MRVIICALSMTRIFVSSQPTSTEQDEIQAGVFYCWRCAVVKIVILCKKQHVIYTNGQSVAKLAANSLRKLDMILFAKSFFRDTNLSW